METRILKINSEDIDGEAIEKAGALIREGELVAFPTETVYGLGGDALNPEASRKIYRAKGRPSDNPLIVHISRFEDLKPLVKEVTEDVGRLMEAFWPGPLTLILKKSGLVPEETTGGLPTVAVRMPSHPVALSFIAAAGGYVAAPSANVSGRPSPTKAVHVMEDLGGRIPLILDGDDSQIGLESTILDMTAGVPTILRPGYITQDMLQKVLDQVETDPSLLRPDCKEPPRAPGMRYRHYAPRGELTVVEGAPAAVIACINDLTRKARSEGKRTGVLGTKETEKEYAADSIKSVGERRDEEAFARNLYRLLREFDEEGTDVIFSESFHGGSLGQAVMNRLLKAAGYRVHKVHSLKSEE